MIIQNAVMRVRDNHIFISRDRHDCIQFVVNETRCMLDGGKEYIRRSTSIAEQVKIGKLYDLTLTDDSTIRELRKKLVWGVRGPTQVMYKLLYGLETAHLRAILKNCRGTIPDLYTFIINNILTMREYGN